MAIKEADAVAEALKDTEASDDNNGGNKSLVNKGGWCRIVFAKVKNDRRDGDVAEAHELLDLWAAISELRVLFAHELRSLLLEYEINEEWSAEEGRNDADRNFCLGYKNSSDGVTSGEEESTNKE